MEEVWEKQQQTMLLECGAPKRILWTCIRCVAETIRQLLYIIPYAVRQAGNVVRHTILYMCRNYSRFGQCYSRNYSRCGHDDRPIRTKPTTLLVTAGHFNAMRCDHLISIVHTTQKQLMPIGFHAINVADAPWMLHEHRSIDLIWRRLFV